MKLLASDYDQTFYINDSDIKEKNKNKCNMLIILSVLFKTDKLNIKKVLAMILGITSVILLAM